MKVLLLFILCFVYLTKTQVDILCTDAFCEDLLTNTPCLSIPEKCSIQNGTHNGLHLPFPGPCNCCDYCLENIGKDEACAIGNPSSSTPTNICGPGLSCNPDDNRCSGLETACTDAQKEYDKRRMDGSLGHLEIRPFCDRNGLFLPSACLPGEVCFCLSESGKRIFGEVVFMGNPDIALRCGCSRSYEAAKLIIGRDLYPYEHFRCTSTGDYDVLQCIGDMCTCVDEVDGAPTYSDLPLVNITEISKDNLPCYDKKIHAPEGEYYFSCERKYIDMLEEINNYKYEEPTSFIGTPFPNCQPDGKYASVQMVESNQICVEPNGDPIESFSVPRGHQLASSMDCKCARSRITIPWSEKSDCCQNGNYRRIQCRRNMCRCVDSNGIQIEKEVKSEFISTLSCYVETPCTDSTIIK